MKRVSISVILVIILIIVLSIFACQSTAEPAQDVLTEEQAESLEQAGALADFVSFPNVDEVRRGCPACHLLVDEETGKYTLAYEAFERAEARGHEHPEVFAPTDEVSVKTCFGCHAPGEGERIAKGKSAPFSLRDIVHPAHMSSPSFKLRYSGSCINCHNINHEGEFEILTEKVDVNEKGVPNPDKLPIPGSIEFHQ